MRNVRKISKKYYVRQVVTFFLVCCMFCNPAVLAEVVHTGTTVGTINVDPVIPNLDPLVPDTQAMTASDGAIGTFSNFDIAGDLVVTCTQGSTSANALFKVNSDSRFFLTLLGMIVLPKRVPPGFNTSREFLKTTLFVSIFPGRQCSK